MKSTRSYIIVAKSLKQMFVMNHPCSSLDNLYSSKTIVVLFMFLLKINKQSRFKRMKQRQKCMKKLSTYNTCSKRGCRDRLAGFWLLLVRFYQDESHTFLYDKLIGIKIYLKSKSLC